MLQAGADVLHKAEDAVSLFFSAMLFFGTNKRMRSFYISVGSADLLSDCAVSITNPACEASLRIILSPLMYSVRLCTTAHDETEIWASTFSLLPGKVGGKRPRLGGGSDASSGRDQRLVTCLESGCGLRRRWPRCPARPATECWSARRCATPRPWRRSTAPALSTTLFSIRLAHQF